MQIHILSVCGKAPQWVSEGFLTYCKRLPKEITLNLKEIPAANRATNSIAKCLELEAKSILAAIPKQSLVIALDERGAIWDSVQLSEKLNQWQLNHPQVCLLIGGPDGFHPSIREHVHETWSLSKLTLPHALIRVILAEQIYRAWTLLNKHPYHRT
ncbi:MAG: 23S rRNA (pseudouridine(1915)-N(3))-methyltransferase RlmH [Gammaproteobacteria bacterium]|jgi:23S rRNA (pseudouridine1915-N3)-methyltransferase